MNAIGLDIGTSSIKAVELTNLSDNKILVANFCKEQISAESTEGLEIAKKEELTKLALKKLLEKTHFKTKRAVVSLLGDDVVIRYVKLPFMSKEELKNAIKYEAEQYIPFNIDNVVLDCQILGEEIVESQKKLNCILVAAKEDAVNRIISLIGSVGLEPAVIDCDVFAIQNSYEANYGVKENETVALINIGARLVSLNIFEDGITRFARDIQFGSNMLIKDISKEFKSDFQSSEKIIIEEASIIIESEEVEITRLPDKTDRSFKIFDTIVSNLTKLVGEIRRSFDFYEAQAKKRAVNKVVISGGGSLIKNLDKFLSEKLKVKVEYHNPFTAISPVRNNISNGTNQNYDAAPSGTVAPGGTAAPMFAVSFGLAVRGIK